MVKGLFPFKGGGETLPTHRLKWAAWEWLYNVGQCRSTGMEARLELKTLVSRGRAAAYEQTHARILLLSDEAQAEGAMKDEEIARALQIGCATVERVRRRCVEAAPGRRQQLRRRRKKPDCQGEAHLIALPPGGPGELDAAVVGGAASRMLDGGPQQRRNGQARVWQSQHQSTR